MAGKKFLVLGGGLGGVVAARELRRLTGNEHNITLIDRKNEHIFLPSLPWVMTGDMKPSGAKQNLSNLEKRGINFVRAEVEAIDLQGRKVETSNGIYDYQYLVVSLGAQLKPGSIPGLEESSINLYELEGMENLYKILKDYKGGKIVVLVCSIARRCAAASVEIPFLLDHFFVKQGIRDKVDIALVTPDPYPFSYLSPSFGEMLKRKFEQREIEYTPRSNVRKIHNNKIYLDCGNPISFDLLLAIPPHHAPDVVKKCGLADKSGWVGVNPETMWTNYEGVYAVGDNVSVPLSTGGFMDRTGLLSELQAKVAAVNLSKAVKGEKMDGRFGGKGFCILETGFGKAIFFAMNFYNPTDVKARMPLESKAFRVAKVMFRKYWFSRWF